MKAYVSELNLDYDPFEPGTPGKEFFAGGERRALVDQIIELSLEGNMLAAVTGPLGSGKSCLAREVRRCFGADAVCLLVSATLFMNQSQFLDALGKQLPKHKHIAATPNVEAGVVRLRQFAAELDLEAQSLILIVDDAHELGMEVLELIDSIVQSASKSSVRAILLGEKQLINLLQNTLSVQSQGNLAHFELAGFDVEDTYNYLQFKLGNAGLNESMPLSGGAIGEIQNASLGIPASINALAAEALAGEYYASAGSDDLDEQYEQDSLAEDADHVPAGKAFNFDAHDHMQFDLDMEESDPAAELEEDAAPIAGADAYYTEADTDDYDAADTDRRVTAVPFNVHEFVQQHRYPVAASLLAVTLFITLFVWTSDDRADGNEVVSTSVDASSPFNAAAPAGGNRIQLPPPVAPPASPTDPVTNNVEVVAAGSGVSSQPDAAPVVESVAEAVVLAPQPAPVAAVTTAVTTSPAAATVRPAAIASEGSNTVSAAPEPAPVEKPAPAVQSKLRPFEQELMKYAANSYTIQILGSHSEANVQQFVANKAVSEKHGYYETRHQNKPCFVVVAGNYRDRAAANAVIERLPQSLRNMQPWIRSVNDVQRDIRQLNPM